MQQNNEQMQVLPVSGIKQSFRTSLSSGSTQAQRPQTARILRPSSEDDSENDVKPSRPQTARERTNPLISNGRKLFVSRPLSAVPVVSPPMGVSASVLRKHWPEVNFYRKGVAKQGAHVENSFKDRVIQDVQAPSPVNWAELEKPSPLAASERRNLIGASGSSDKCSRSRGKYEILCPTKPHELRQSSSPYKRPRQDKLDSASGFFLTLKDTNSFVQRPQSDRVSQATDARTNRPKGHWDIKDFFTPQEFSNFKIVAKSEPFLHRNEKHDFITQESLDHVIAFLPFACDGRLMLDAQFKKVLVDREAGLIERIEAYNLQKESQEETELIRKNLETVRDPGYRSSNLKRIIARAREKVEKVKQIKQKKADLDKEYRKNVEADLEWRMKATERKKQRSDQARLSEHIRFLLTAVTLHKVSRNLWVSLSKELESRKTWAKKKVAAKTIIKHLMKFRMKKSSRREGNALMILAMRLPMMVKRWKARSLARKTCIIISYLRDISNFAKLQLAVKQFRRRIVKAQQLAKNWLACKRARYQMLEMQFNKVDEIRNQEHNMRREAQLSKIKARLDSQLDVKGNPLATFRTKVLSIERIGGPKAVREFKADIESSRIKFCEKFLSPDLQQLTQISPIVKTKMLQLYVRKVRARYQLELAAYRMKRAVWAELQESQTSIRHFADDFSDDLSNPSAVTFFKQRVGEVVPDLEPPKRPLFHIVLQPHLMEQIVEKAVEHTQKLADRSLACQSSSRGILKGNNPHIVPKPRRQESKKQSVDADFE